MKEEVVNVGYKNQTQLFSFILYLPTPVNEVWNSTRSIIIAANLTVARMTITGY
jgi:hypothetical protein